MASCSAILAVILVVVVAAVAAVGSSAGAAGEGPAPQPVGCTVDGHFMAVGEVFNTGPEPCNTYTCHAPDTIYALTCAYFTAGEGCEIVPGNQTAAYPLCCPTESCSENLINVDV